MHFLLTTIRPGVDDCETLGPGQYEWKLPAGWLLIASGCGPNPHSLILETPSVVLVAYGELQADATGWTRIKNALPGGWSFDEAAHHLAGHAGAANGTFAAVLCDRGNARARIFGDRLGIRPIYWGRRGQRSAIGTTRRSVSAVLGGGHDMVGIVQRFHFGAPIGSRTIYEGVDRSLSRQVFFLEKGELSVASTPIVGSNAEYPDMSTAAAAVEHAFAAAVKDRFNPENPAPAMLSGGLDSRSIVASLRMIGNKPRCITLGNAGLADHAIATMYAKEHNLPLHSASFNPCRRIIWAMRTRIAMRIAGIGSHASTSINTVWSGDGGSVCLGGVYMTPALIDCFTPASASERAELLLREFGFRPPTRLLSTSDCSRISLATLSDITESVSRNGTHARSAAYSYLVAEDQRRHLDDHFEYLCGHEIEYLLPFFDSRLIDVTRRVQDEWLSRHNLYMRWLGDWHPEALAVPWQAYPGHLPCPIAEQVGPTQWSAGATNEAAKANAEFTRQQLWRWAQSGFRAFGMKHLLTSTFAAFLAGSRLGRGEHFSELAAELAHPEWVGGFDQVE